MIRFLSGLLGMLLCATSVAQVIDFGQSTQPSNTDQIDALIYYGEEMTFEGGYQVGETVGDFTIYNFDGQSINLYETLGNGKPTIMMSGSVSCPRFTNGFLQGSASGMYQPMRDFINQYQNDFNWICVYGIEAHPTEGECPSNCPPGGYNDTTVVQHETYLYRRHAVND